MKKEVAFPREEGQSLVLVAFAIIVLVGFVGLGVDLGLAYIERVRIQRAADAAALAAASELSSSSEPELAAGLRALEYLAENDYDCGLSSPVNINNPCTDPTVRLEVATSRPVVKREVRRPINMSPARQIPTMPRLSSA